MQPVRSLAPQAGQDPVSSTEADMDAESGLDSAQDGSPEPMRRSHFEVSSEISPIDELDPQTISQGLSTFTVMRGHFSQVRHLDGRDGGLRSSGQYVFWRDHGVYWHTEQPIERAVTYRSDVTLDWRSGEPVATQRPGDESFRRILMGVFSFDLKQLEQEFELQWRIDDSDWILQLVPRQSGTRRFLSSLTLYGSTTVSGMELARSNGEVVVVRFSDTAAQTQLPLQDCLSLFAFSEQQCLAQGEVRQANSIQP
ncbi:MAG: outer membrane lipoprotein carrier protein LolA [Pseudomonadota bacterium]